MAQIILGKPVSELVQPNQIELIKKLLKDSPEKAFTIYGIMVNQFGTKIKDIGNKDYSDWNKQEVNLYEGIRKIMKQLEKENFVKVKKEGRQYFYWHKY